MIKALTENPGLKAKSDNITVQVVNDGMRYCDCAIAGESVELNSGILTYDWEIVTKPVDFMTAINSGKNIRAHRHKNFHSVDWYIDYQLNLGEFNGDWFIEGGE